MTTIAYRDGVLAGDGRETNSGDDESAIILTDNCVKVHRLEDGRLYGGSRGSEDIQRLHEALEQRKPLPELSDINAILIDKRGRIWLYEGHIWQPCRQAYYAVGSGSVYAFAAMDAGATAVQAVKVGIKRDPFSGGKVSVVRLQSK